METALLERLPDTGEKANFWRPISVRRGYASPVTTCRGLTSPTTPRTARCSSGQSRSADVAGGGARACPGTGVDREFGEPSDRTTSRLQAVQGQVANIGTTAENAGNNLVSADAKTCLEKHKTMLVASNVLNRFAGRRN
jgi:hypothetical protein